MRRGSQSKQEREAREAMEELRALQEQGYRLPEPPAPGDPPGDFDTLYFTVGGSGRLHGRYGICLWASATLLLFDWEIQAEQEFADGTAHGEYWDNPVPLKMMWSGTARTYITTEPPSQAYSNASWLTWAASNYLLYTGFRVSGDPSAATFVGYNRPSTGNHPIFTGSAYVSRASLQMPRSGMAVQEVQLRGIAAPSVGPQV